MQIQIGQDDGVLHGGVPKLVVLTIIDGEKQISFPFQADQPISAIYVAAQKAFGSPVLEFMQASLKLATAPVDKVIADAAMNVKIQKRDLVRYTGKPSEEGDDLKPGHIYRVLKTSASQIEMMDDASPNPIRLTVPVGDVVLSEKAKPVTAVKKTTFETTHVCQNCNHIFALLKNKSGVYAGQCPECNTAASVTL